jgi:glycosyltransferase involved in cell wall biosynthesis
VGHGAERLLHEAHADRLGILNKNVFFSGFKNTEAVAETMRRSDALLMFSHFEGMPVTIIEAQCCGLPVIASAVGAVPEMVSPANGFLVKPGDETALEKAILELKEKKTSFNPAAIREKAVAIYSRASVSRELDRLYQSVLRNG